MSVVFGFFLGLFLSFFLLMVGLFLPNFSPELEKKRPYECGFDPMKSPRTPFSFRFFLVAILFLMFDLEMALLLPFISSVSRSLDMSLLFLCVFMFLLVGGLVFEWVKGGLDWAE